MRDKDFTILLLIQETCDKILNYSEGMKNGEDLERDIKSFDAIVMNFIVLSESIGKLSEGLKKNYTQIDWRKIYAFRNVLGHDYFGILPEEDREIIEKDVPQLKIDISRIVDSLNRIIP